MFGNVCRGIAGERYEDLIKEQKEGAGVDGGRGARYRAAEEPDQAGSRSSSRTRPARTSRRTRRSSSARRSSPCSTRGPAKRAVEYRRINHIPDDWGTAVNVQQMVFGNKGDSSCSGVAFSRDEITGEPTPSGDFLPNAQGEDVVSGVRTPRDLHEMKESMPEAYDDLMDILRTLESHYGDMQDTEFTVEEGSLYMLQTRNAKRPAQAAVRFAVDAVEEGLLDKARGDRHDRRRRGSTRCCTPASSATPTSTCSPRAWPPRPAPRRARSSSPPTTPSSAAEDGRDVILVRPFTEADDVAGFHAAKGILTAEGGKASHAALVARGMGKPCVSGAVALDIDLHAKTLSVNGTRLGEGDLIAIDGSAGRGHGRRRAARGARGVGPLRDGPRLGRRAPHARRSHQRRHARGRAPRARVRRRGHRPLPHRAHVHGRGPPAEDARDDHGRVRGGPPRRARRAAAAPAGRLRGPLRGDGGPAGDDPAARPAAPRVHAAGRGGRAGRRARAHRADRQPRGARAHAGADPLAVRDEPDARHSRRAARRAPPRGLRDADPRDLPRRARDRRAAAARDHDPAGGLRARDRADARAGRAGGRTRRAPASSTSPSAR